MTRTGIDITAAPFVQVPDKGYRVSRCFDCDRAFTWKGQARPGCPLCGDTMQTTTRRFKGGFTLLEGDALSRAELTRGGIDADILHERDLEAAALANAAKAEAALASGEAELGEDGTVWWMREAYDWETEDYGITGRQRAHGLRPHSMREAAAEHAAKAAKWQARKDKVAAQLAAVESAREIQDSVDAERAAEEEARPFPAIPALEGESAQGHAARNRAAREAREIQDSVAAERAAEGKPWVEWDGWSNEERQAIAEGGPDVQRRMEEDTEELERILAENRPAEEAPQPSAFPEVNKLAELMPTMTARAQESLGAMRRDPGATMLANTIAVAAARAYLNHLERSKLDIGHHPAYRSRIRREAAELAIALNYMEELGR